MFATPFFRISSKLYQARFFRMEIQSEFLQSFLQIFYKPLRLTEVLESYYKVVRETHHYHIALCYCLSPLIYPLIKYVM